MTKILFTHLLNNYTGSPKVLATELSLLSQNSDFEISLLTSKTDGILSSLPNVRFYDNGYRWSNNRLALGILFLYAQIRSFLFVLCHRYDVVYVNTLLPFGAAFAAKLRGEKIIYHVHEVYIKPNLFKRFSYFLMKKCADRIICVSRYVQEHMSSCAERTCVIYNPIENHEVPCDVDSYLKKKFDGRMIFMPTSLKEYKGVNQFVELARMLPDYRFSLLCSVSLEEMQTYFSAVDLPENVTLIGKQNTLLEFYREAAVTMNLSLQDKCIETFGLTIAEGFDTLTPAVAPAFGGPKEIVMDGENGFLVNPYDLEQVSSAIHALFADFEVYRRFALAAKKSVKRFDVNDFKENILSEISEVQI